MFTEREAGALLFDVLKLATFFMKYKFLAKKAQKKTQEPSPVR